MPGPPRAKPVPFGIDPHPHFLFALVSHTYTRFRRRIKKKGVPSLQFSGCVVWSGVPSGSHNESADFQAVYRSIQALDDFNFSGLRRVWTGGLADSYDF